MKKIFGVLFALIIVLSGCGNKEIEGDGVLTVWYWDPYINGASVQLAADKYTEANPDTQFQFVEMSRDDLDTKFTTAALAGDMTTLPDVILLGDDKAPMYLSLYPNVFSDSLNETINYEDFPDYKVASVTKDDTSYGVPFDNGVSGLFCNKKIVEQAGLTEQDFQNITWTQFDALGKQIHDKTGKYGYTWDAISMLDNLAHSTGADYVTPEDDIYIADNPGVKAGLELMQKMYSGGYVYDSVDWTDYVNSISTNNAACTLTGAWFVPTIKQLEDAEGNWFIAPSPTLEGVENAAPATANGGSAWYVLNTGDEELATDFLTTTFGSDVELYDQLLNDVGLVATYLPASKSDAYNQNDSIFNDEPVYKNFMDWSAEVPSFDILENAAVARDSIKNEITSIVKGEESVEDGINNAQQQAEQSVV